MLFGFIQPFLAWRKGFVFALILAYPIAAFADEPVDLGTVVVEERSPKNAPSRDATAAAKFYGDVVGAIANGKFVGGLLLADSDQFRSVKKELEAHEAAIAKGAPKPAPEQEKP